jgi:hypothetical protein
MILQNIRQLPVCIFRVKIAALGSLKMVTELIFKLSKLFQRSKLKLGLVFSLTRKQKTVKTISTCTESTYLLL